MCRSRDLGNNIHLIPDMSINEQCFILFCSFPLLFAFVVGGLGFELCVFVTGWRHALRSEWPFIIIIYYYGIIELKTVVNNHAVLVSMSLFKKILLHRLPLSNYGTGSSTLSGLLLHPQ